MSAGKIRVPDFQTRVMDNGLRVIMMPMEKMPLISVKCVIKSGTTADGKGKSGSASLTLELLKKGSGDNNAAQFSEAVDFSGGVISTGATPDYSVISANFLQKDLPSALQFIGDMVLRPHFPDVEFYTAQQRISAAIHGIKDNPSSLTAYFFQTYFYGPSHPYGNPEDGIIHEIEALQPEDIRLFFSHNFTANNAAIIVTGRFQIEDAFEKIQKIFSTWSSGEIRKSDRTTITPRDENRFFLLDQPDAVQTHIRMGIPGIYQNHGDTFPLTVANSLFGGGFTSRLNDEIRVKRGLTYSVSSGFTRMYHQGAFTIGTFTKTASTGEMMRAVFTELQKLHDEKPENKEIHDTIRYLSGTYPLSLETAEQFAGKLARMVVYNLPATWISDYIPSLKAVTTPELQKVIDRYFAVTGYTCILTGRSRQIEPQIRGFGNVSVVPEKDIRL